MESLKNKPKEYWKKKLTSDQFHITREDGTEPPFSGKYYLNKEAGKYKCINCGQELFSSEAKYESGSGWPSFYDAIDKDKLELSEDKSLGMQRIEVKCGNCGAHLGHLFNDGPKPTGKRFCINSGALDFIKNDKKNPT